MTEQLIENLNIYKKLIMQLNQLRFMQEPGEPLPPDTELLRESIEDMENYLLKLWQEAQASDKDELNNFLEQIKTKTQERISVLRQSGDDPIEQIQLEESFTQLQKAKSVQEMLWPLAVILDFFAEE